MKKIQMLKSRGLVMAALLLGSASLAFGQTPTTNLNDFNSGINGTPGQAPSGCGTAYGSGAIVWDNSELYPGTTGSAYVEALFSTGSDHPLANYICFPNDNWYYNGQGNVDFANYTAVQFQVLWDTNNSTMSIDQFNNPSTFQSELTNSYQGIQLDYTVGSGDQGTLGFFNIPDAASNGWVTVTVPIPNSLFPTIGGCGIMMFKYINNVSQITGTPPNALFWVANVQLIGNEGPPPPPTLSVPAKPAPGLNVWNATSGNGPYDRNEVGMLASNGVTWVASATALNPVTYSFTISSFPSSPAYTTEAYLMMAPDPAAYDNALDYNEPNCVNIFVQSAGAASSILTFQYKENQPGTENYSTVIQVPSAHSPVGTWSITFTSPTNVTVTGSDGAQTSFIFTNGADFAETPVGPHSPGAYLYLGGQANNADAFNQALVYSSFSISGLPSATNDNFLADSTLNTNIWLNSMSHAPAGVFVMSPSAESWVTWSLPAAGFQLRDSPNVTGPWTVVGNGLFLPEVGQVSRLITTNDVPAGTPAQYFDLATP